MKRLLLYTIKRTLVNSTMLSMAILFVLFWGVIIAYLEAPSFISQLQHVSLAFKNTVYLQYTSVWNASLVILSLSTIAVGIAYILYFQTGALPYLIRYTKLKASTYFASLYSGNLIASLILELLLIAIITLMFSHNGVGIAVTPSNIGIMILAIILGSIFFISFSVFLNLLVIRLRAYKLLNLFNYIPLIIGTIVFALFAFATITIKSPAIYYSNPYTATLILLYYGYFGSFKLYTTAGTAISLHLSIGLLALSIVAWTIVLNLLNSVLVRKIQYVNIEEMRIM